MTIQTTRQIIIQRLAEVQSAKGQKTYSAMDLRGGRPLLDRIQRKENLRFQHNLNLQEVKLLKDLALIDDYLKTSTLKDTPLIAEPSTSLWSTIPTPTKTLTRLETKAKILKRTRRRGR